jgi:UDP-N-acetylmuramoylalanine--D-glutamate ligase
MLAKDMRDKAVYIWGVGVEGQAAMRAFAGNKIAVILGGFDNKSANWKPIEDFVAENDDVAAIIGLPDTGHWIKSPKLRRVGASMRDAVEAAVDSLPDGGVVLLSPAAQSFNMYKNYKERGADFAKCAKTMIDKQQRRLSSISPQP